MMENPDKTPRQAILNAARSWLGTPYRHRAKCKGAGTDCLGLLLGLFEEIYGRLPETPPPYTKDWGEIASATNRHEPLLAAAHRHLVPQTKDAMRPADVLLFRMHPQAPIKHAAVLMEDNKILHAYSGHGVCLSTFGNWWQLKLAAVFSFPIA